MTPDYITFTDDGHAWWVGPNSNLDAEWDAARFRQLDQPCGTCGGKQEYRTSDNWRSDVMPCDCIDGRVASDIKTNAYPAGGCPSCGDSGIGRSGDGVCSTCCYLDVHRVSVVPGMVLPIVGLGVGVPSAQYVRTYPGGPVLVGNPSRPMQHITLPSAAAPGMWAVKLRVAS